MKNLLYFFFLSFVLCFPANAQVYWHGKERVLRYKPMGEDIVIVNGDKKFTRALYGTNTAFRIETGDIPEFGFFMPHMGGNMQFGLLAEGKSLWLNDAEYIKSIYRAGSRIYEIKDPFIGSGKIELHVLAMSDADGMILKIETTNIPQNIKLITTFGGANGMRFNRNGDLGVDDPTAFNLKPEGCEGNVFDLDKNHFVLSYGQNTKDGERKTSALFPENSELKIASPYKMMTPRMVWQSSAKNNYPIVVAGNDLQSNETLYIALKASENTNLAYSDPAKIFIEAEKKRSEIAGTVKISTPDPYFNPLGGVLSTAADGIWEPDCWQHGAIGWRMPLNGWRAAYVGDAVGWHDRARAHFDGYAASQITNIEPVISHPAQDTTLNLARAAKIWGTPMYSNGYICRNQYDTTKMHHYDMNLVYIDELLWHFNWTGDWDYVRKMWPTLKLHLEWEKRNFDPDNDGLYDAYASIWASDALQYNSGGVTHSSAYNYRANKMAAMIAQNIGEDPQPYIKESEKILQAINSRLWLTGKGWWAEFQDFMGNKTIHPNAAIWTVYHAIDSDIHTPFQAYQATRYIDTEIPHIPVIARGLEDEGYSTISTTNWLPYSWSINNVALAEVAHTALAYWQSGRNEEAFKLFKSSILDNMYIGSSPGNIGQISFYDSARGECYRDFGDPIGIYSRALVQGLFGILPDALNRRLLVRPGFPAQWNSASFSTSDISFTFSRTGTIEKYEIENRLENARKLELQIKAQKDIVKAITVNGKKAAWHLKDGIDLPLLSIDCGIADKYTIEIEWTGDDLNSISTNSQATKGEEASLTTKANIQKVYDPQGVLKNTKIKSNTIKGEVAGETGFRTLFVKLKQGDLTWWEPVNIEIKEIISIHNDAEAKELSFSLTNNSTGSINATLILNDTYNTKINLDARSKSSIYNIPAKHTVQGSNRLQIIENGRVLYETLLTNWSLENDNPTYETINIDAAFNASASQIFKNSYLTPRSPYTTLQTPVQGIGEWCHPTLMVEIDDSGLRAAAKEGNFLTPFGIPFRTTEENTKNNIAFTTLWDNYPDSLSVSLSGKAKHAYLLMAGSTNHMQCHIVNGTVTVSYKDGTCDVLELINPETWAPIEQDFFVDNMAFKLKQPRPYRVALKTGVVSRNIGDDTGINPDEVYGRTINGGAAIILDIPLQANKELKGIQIKSIANEVVIGLMSVTLLK